MQLNILKYGSNTLDRRRGRPQRSNHWDGNRTRSLERGKKGEMEQQMRNADSGLDLDDSGSANESYFHQSEPERRTASGSTSQSGKNLSSEPAICSFHLWGGVIESYSDLY